MNRAEESLPDLQGALVIDQRLVVFALALSKHRGVIQQVAEQLIVSTEALEGSGCASDRLVALVKARPLDVEPDLGDPRLRERKVVPGSGCGEHRVLQRCLGGFDISRRRLELTERR